MVSLLKDKLGRQYFCWKKWPDMDQWKAEDEELAIKAIKRIEQEAHTSGLTDRITKFLEEEKHGIYEER